MGYLIAGVGALGILFLLARVYTSLDPAGLVRALRYGVGGALALFGVLLMVAERWGLGGMLLAAGLSIVTVGRIGPLDFGSTRRTRGSVSTVRTAWLEMRLDHDSGAMAGVVRRGARAGASLDDLDERALLEFAGEVAGDGESAALLEAYLDRRIPDWREHVEGDGAAGPRGTADAGPMTDKQAYEILGLAPGASQAEIRAAHHRLMKRVHPDQGGSTFLAAKINQAKDWLLGNHR